MRLAPGMIFLRLSYILQQNRTIMFLGIGILLSVAVLPSSLQRFVHTTNEIMFCSLTDDSRSKFSSSLVHYTRQHVHPSHVREQQVVGHLCLVPRRESFVAAVPTASLARWGSEVSLHGLVVHDRGCPGRGSATRGAHAC